MQVIPVFTPGEAVSNRTLAPGITAVPVWHEGQATELVARVLLARTTDQGGPALLRQALPLCCPPRRAA